MTETIMGHFAKDHDRLDAIFKEIREVKKRDPEKAKKMFSEFKTGLQRHIVWEEEILFPLFEERTGLEENGPTAVMRTEHRKIKGLLDKIHDSLARFEFKTDVFEEELLEVLTGHNQKEESILYPWIDNFVGEEERGIVFAKMRDLPEEKYRRCCHD